MLDARDVARMLIRFGYDTESPGESVLVCPLRLQKLLYYCQGWSLALLGRPLFKQSIEAWPHGPVVKDVYDQFAGKRDGITPEQAGEVVHPLSETEAALLDTVYREYAKHTPGELVTMTHCEPAWVEARAGLPEKAPSNVALSLATMEEYFHRLTERIRESCPSKFPMPSPAEMWQKDEAWERAGKPVRTVESYDDFKAMAAGR